MENASKALVMIGGILIAVLLIALLYKSFFNVRDFQISQLSEEEQKQIAEFNSRYVRLLNEYVYGNEVITLMNKYEDDNLVEVLFNPGTVPTMNPERY